MANLAVVLASCAALLAACGGAAKRSGPVPNDLDDDLVHPREPSESTAAGTAPTSATATPPADTAPSKDDCDALIRAGTAKHDKGDFAGAVESYQAALPHCERTYAVHTEMGNTLAALGKIDDAAAHYIAELRGRPVPATFANLLDILPKLSPDRRMELATIATTREAPLRVPDIAYEYTWVGHFACTDGRGKPKKQALINVAGKQLDAMSYTCPDQSEREAFFDFSAEPAR